MRNEPQIQQRAEQPYVAIPARVTTEAEFRQAADSGFPELFGWLKEHGIEPTGPLFIRYLLVDEGGQPLEIELAVPCAEGVSGGGRVQAGVLPAGRYVTLLHIGPYRSETAPDLAAARTALEAWARERGIVYSSQTDRGSALPGCVEHYLTGPVEEPDHSKWQTELARLAIEEAPGQISRS
jgi:hypothetical protein